MHAALVVLGVLSALNIALGVGIFSGRLSPRQGPGTLARPRHFPRRFGLGLLVGGCGGLAISIGRRGHEPFNSTGWAGIAVLLVGFAILMTAHASERP